MRNVLILGAIEAFCDIIEDIKTMGMNPICCDYYEYAAAKNDAKVSYNISTTDVEQLFEVSQKHKISGVITAFSDRNLLPALDLCKRLGFPSFYNEDIIKLLTDKIRMKAHFVNNKIPVIPYVVVEGDEDMASVINISYPVIVKPIDGYGSKGISICNTFDEIDNARKEATKASKDYKRSFIVEEYYEADEISIAAWVKRGRAYITGTYDVGRNFEKQVLLSYVAFPSKYEKEYYNRFVDLVQKITNSLCIEEGPITVQCYIGDKGLMVGEYLYRLAGGSPYLYSVQMGGPNTAKMLIDYQVGNKIDYQNLTDYKASFDNVYYDILVYAKNNGRINYSYTIDKLRRIDDNIVRLITYHRNGEDISKNPNKEVLVARIFYRKNKDDKRSYVDILNQLDSIIEILDEKGEEVHFFRYPSRNFENRRWSF